MSGPGKLARWVWAWLTTGDIPAEVRAVIEGPPVATPVCAGCGDGRGFVVVGGIELPCRACVAAGRVRT